MIIFLLNCLINFSLCSAGSVRLKINGWVNISFCLPHKVHNLNQGALHVKVHEYKCHALHQIRCSVVSHIIKYSPLLVKSSYYHSVNHATYLVHICCQSVGSLGKQVNFSHLCLVRRYQDQFSSRRSFYL